MARISRPRFALLVLACSAGVFSPGLAQRRATVVVPDVARSLPLTAVRLTGGPLKHAQDLDASYLLALEPDRMLAFYRQRAGLEPKAQPYGGWDGDGRNLTGHIAGHHLSAVSLMWEATGDARFKQRADYIVGELKLVQDKHGDGYVGALAGVREAFAEAAKGNIRSAFFDLNGLWSPWYVLHKTFAGLRDAYRHTGNRTALDEEIKFAEWAERVLAPLDETQIQRLLNTEFGGMNEVLADLYADTGDKRWLALSYRFEHRAVLDPLKRQEDRLDGLHGNTQVPKILGSAARFAYTGNEDDRRAATFFWDRVVGHHTFATGGHGKDEYFREPDRLGNIVDGRTAETCNVYNMLKLTRRLFALQPDVKYAEFLEQALFNHILGSIDAGDGSTCYMVPVGHGVRREYQDMKRDFTCCVGSGMESHALHGDGIYYESGDRLWVNLYAPSTAQWDAAGVKLQMDTSFPEGETATITVAVREPKAFTLALRRPSWAGEGFSVKVNGDSMKDLPRPGAYAELTRTWSTGDAVSLVLPKALRLDVLGDHPKRAAVLWGPLVLAGDLGAAPEGEPGVPSPPPNVPVLVAADRPVTEWLKPVPGKPGTFRSSGVGRDPSVPLGSMPKGEPSTQLAAAASGPKADSDVEFVPFYRIHRRIYTAYWDLVTPAEYEAKVGEIAAERERQRTLDDATVAFVRPGEPTAERPFHQQGEETSVIEADGRTGRRAAKWFSFDLPIDASPPMALVVTYNSDTRRTRTFEVLVDGQRVGQQTLEQNSVSRFFDVEYPLPVDLVRGQQNVTVRFQATNGNETAPVFGIRMIRARAGR